MMRLRGFHAWKSLKNHRRFIMRRRSVLLSAVSGVLTGALTLGRSQGVPLSKHHRLWPTIP
jgi:hypothetical protein